MTPTPTEYDLVAIGAGPAGSCAARHAAAAGLRTLLLEKRQQVGFPVRCAEAVGRDGLRAELSDDLRLFPAGPDGDLAAPYRADHLAGGVAVAPSGREVYAAKADAGWVLDRKVFDLHLAERAVEAGAELWVKSSALSVKREADRWLVAVRRPEGETTVRARVLVGADGVESQVGRWCGLAKALIPSQVHGCAQFLLAGLPGTVRPQTVYFYLGSAVAPGGYAWLFPKGPRQANVGLGILPGAGRLTARAYLERFVAARFPDCSILEEVTGCVPATPPPERLVGDGVLLAGDAARQVDPFSGAGINWALEAGRLAAETIVEVLRRGAPTAAKHLAPYELTWQARHRREHQKLHQIKQLVNSLTDKEIESAVTALASGLAEGGVGDLSPARMLGHIVRHAPGLLLKLRHLL